MTQLVRSTLLVAALMAAPAAHGDGLRERGTTRYRIAQAEANASRSGGATADAKPPIRFAVTGGWLNVSTGHMPERKAAIRYNDSLIADFPGELLVIDGFVSVRGANVLLYASNPGGSGTLDSHGLIAVNDQGQVYRAALPAGSERYAYRIADDRIAFDLGTAAGKTVRAVFASGRLDVRETPIPKGPLSDGDCTMLYSGLLEECAEPRQMTCAYDAMALSMASLRPVNLLAANNPNYRPAAFKASCEQACKAKRKPSFARFRKAVCQPR